MARYGSEYRPRNTFRRPDAGARHWFGEEGEGRWEAEPRVWQSRRAEWEDEGWGRRSPRGEERWGRGGGVRDWFDRAMERGDFGPPPGARGRPRYESDYYEGGPRGRYRGVREDAYDADYGYRGGGGPRRGYPREEDRPMPRRRGYAEDYSRGMHGESYGDYHGGGFGTELFRNARSGGIAPGRYFTGYGIGSSGGYEPF